MSKPLLTALVLVCIAYGAVAQNPQPESQAAAPADPLSSDDISGMYSFTREGEFVQISVDDQRKVTGFVSRFGDMDSDRGAFLDHFFKSASLEADTLTFTTEKVHSTWFEFKGRIARGDKKAAGQEGYYVIRGTLTQFVSDAHKRVASRVRELEMKSFPRDAALTAIKRD